VIYFTFVAEMEKIITQILQADDRAHHHTTMVVAGVFLSGFMAFWQLLMPHMETFAYNPAYRCGPNSGAIDIPYDECITLTELYEETAGNLWTNNANWHTTTTICNNWYGVSCTGIDGSGFAHVQTLDLDENGLSGEIPASIGSLTFLDYLALGTNNLYGEVPQELWTIPTLRSVSLYRNDLSGSLSSDFSQATGLRSLFVNSNPDLIIDFDTFVTLNPNIEFLNIDETSFT